MKLRDRNIKFSHRKASWRAKKNNIFVVRKSNSCLTKNLEEMHGIANSFFKQLHTYDISVDTSHTMPLVKDNMNADLCKHFSDQEISDALFQIGPLKAPRPYGFKQGIFSETRV